MAPILPKVYASQSAVTNLRRDPCCEKCSVPLTTALMAVYCARREQCHFWPDDEQGQEFIRLLRGDDFDLDKLTGAHDHDAAGSVPHGEGQHG